MLLCSITAEEHAKFQNDTTNNYKMTALRQYIYKITA